jgi:hypothetical protein
MDRKSPVLPNPHRFGAPRLPEPDPTVGQILVGVLVFLVVMVVLVGTLVFGIGGLVSVVTGWPLVKCAAGTGLALIALGLLSVGLDDE